MKISACLIVKNEEKNLPAYIDGVKDIADEVIVADTGSTDNSVKLLENLKREHNLNLSIYNYKWNSDFAAAKNFALSKATGDWIIFLDADEYFSKEDRQRIRPFLDKIESDKRIMAIETELINIDTDNNDEIISKARQTRIFRREGISYRGKIHETLSYKGETPPCMEADFTIIHTGYSKNALKGKETRNFKIILSQKDFARDDTPATYFYLAEAHFDAKNLKKAEECAKKAVELMKKSDDYFLVCAYTLYIEIKTATGAEDTKAIIEEALAATKNHPDMLIEKLIFALNNGEYSLTEIENLAEDIFTLSKDAGLMGKYLNSGGAKLPAAHFALGTVYRANGVYDKAEREFLAALELSRYRANALKETLDLWEGEDKKSEMFIAKHYDIKKDGKFLAKVFETRPRDGLYRKFGGAKKDSADYKLASGDIAAATETAAKEVERAKDLDLTKDEGRKNLKEKLQILAICFLFGDIELLAMFEKELNLLPPSVIAVILRFYGEELPPVQGEAASYNVLKEKAYYLPKRLRDRFLDLY